VRTTRLASLDLLLGFQGTLKNSGQVSGFSDAPVVKKDDPRFLEKHMVVDGNHLDRPGTKFADDRSNFEFKHRNVAAYRGPLLRALKRRPRVVPALSR
jgi:hypothetical protein